MTHKLASEGPFDALHVHTCAVLAQISHLKHKMKIPLRTYKATVTHCRQILGSTSGNPATWNDKTIVLYNELIRGAHEDKLSMIIFLPSWNMMKQMK